MGRRVPAVIYQGHVTPVGSPIFGYSNVADFTYEGLFASVPHYRLKGGAWSGGGPFYVYKDSLEHSSAVTYPMSVQNSQLGPFTMRGVSPYIGASVPPPPSVPSYSTQQSNLSGSFATGWKRTRPGNPQAGLGQFLVELRDLPKVPLRGFLKQFSRLMKRAGSFHRIPLVLLRDLSAFRELGSEYLNVEFGWRPFVNDLQQMYNLWKTIDRQMAQIIRENGKTIHRKTTLEDDTSTSQTGFSNATPFTNVAGAPPAIMPGATQYSLVTRTYTRVWYSAAYRYWIPDVSSSLWDARARAALFGVLPTPELLWNVLPWSWLVDWFSNVGDVVSNLSPNAVDNLVASYAFVMKHTIVEGFAQASVFAAAPAPGSIYHYGGFDGAFWSRRKTEVKVRVGGDNPFGLGVTVGDLSNRQLGILAALGISRAKVH